MFWNDKYPDENLIRDHARMMGYNKEVLCAACRIEHDGFYSYGEVQFFMDHCYMNEMCFSIEQFERSGVTWMDERDEAEAGNDFEFTPEMVDEIIASLPTEILMNYEETKDYTNFVCRKPTDEEIDKIILFEDCIAIPEELEAALTQPQKAKIAELMSERKSLLRETGFVFDFTAIHMRFFFRTQISIAASENGNCVYLATDRYLIDKNNEVNEVIEEERYFPIN